MWCAFNYSTPAINYKCNKKPSQCRIYIIRGEYANYLHIYSTYLCSTLRHDVSLFCKTIAMTFT